MAVTIKDVAKVCNVSHSTVSRVLNKKCVRETEQTERIVATAKALGYKPNMLAVQLVKRSSTMLGLLIPDIANPHYGEITKCVEDSALAAGYHVFLCNTDWDVRKEKLYRDSLLESQVAGIIVMPVCDESHGIFRGLNTPVVLLGSRTREKSLHYVVMDNERAAYQATGYLLSLGRKRPLYIGRGMQNYTSSDRARGFLNAVRNTGMPEDQARVAESAGLGLEGGYLAVKGLFDKGFMPDAILAFSDFIALGAIQFIEEQGLVVGRDVAVIGFDDIQFSSFPKIALTTITPSNKELGRIAVELVFNHKSELSGMGQASILETKMIKRRTCGGI